ncbi:beta-sarcoglycan [Anthonomus grandis grandis]|uniref:beta-sarcoglycan n=1 Tax=Anthonomus grandis grandis TaxID=2921223 RepID=UPI0021666A5F|nr:beta-sarcoglycan [Anthonomus grandis grandis]
MEEFITASPQHSEVISEENDVSSSKEECLLENTNVPKTRFTTAYVTIQKPHKSAIKEKKTFAFWTLVILLFLLAVGNLILTMTILGVLRIGNGMQSIELLPEEKSLKLSGDVDLDRIYKQNNVLEGFEGENLDITSEDGSIFVNLYTRINRIFNKIRIEKNFTSFNGFDSFEVKTKNKESIFKVNNPVFDNLKSVNTLKSKIIATNKVRSKLHENLKIEGNVVHLKGNEGSKIEAREIVWSADQDIYLRSINGSILLSGKEGTYIDVERLPIAKVPKKSFLTAQFKICVCMPQGKLFRLPIANVDERVYCHQADMSEKYNPCM